MRHSVAPIRIVLAVTADWPTKDSVEHLLASLPKVDAYVFGCSAVAAGATGASADNGNGAWSVLTSGLLERGMRGVILPSSADPVPWADAFGAARLLAGEHAWPMDRTYVIRLKPNQNLHLAPQFDPSTLVADGYELRHESASVRQFGLALVSLAFEWRDPEVGDELWEPFGRGCRVERHEQLWIEQGFRATATVEQLQQRLTALRAWDASESNNPRYIYCLGQTLYESCAFAEASAVLSRLRNSSIPSDLRWYSGVLEGLCLLYSDCTDAGIYMLSAAHQARPDRAEPLVALARHYRAQGDMQRAFELARHCIELRRNAPSESPVDKSVYNAQIWEEVMLTAYYVGEGDLGRAACERLISRRDASPEYQEYIARNEQFYVRQLIGRERGNLSVSERVRRDTVARYVCSNPTVTEFEGRIVANVRLVNYLQENGWYYRSTASDGIIRTRNVSLEREPRCGHWHSERESCVDLPATWRRDVPVRGLEDMRWVTYQGRVWFTATCCHVPGFSPMPQIVLGRLNEQRDRIEHLVHAHYDGAASVEKNWMPWVHGRTLYLIYSYDPFVVLRTDLVTGTSTPAFCSEPQWNAKRFRGSTPPLAIPGSKNWVALVHEVTHLPHGRLYLHRFVEIGADFELLRRSGPFYFDHCGIEYAAGICAMENDRVLITYGYEDREARWVTVDWDEIMAALQDNRHDDETETYEPVAPHGRVTERELA